MTSQPKSEDRIRYLPSGRDQICGKSYYTPVGRESDDRKSRDKKQSPRCLFCEQAHVSSNCNDVVPDHVTFLNQVTYSGNLVQTELSIERKPNQITFG